MSSVDISKLKGVLGKAKHLIKNDDKVDMYSENYTNTNVSKNTSSKIPNVETDNVELLSSIPNTSKQINDPVRGMGRISEETIRNSKLPDSVKKMLMENPVQNPMNPMTSNTFNLEDVSDLVEKPNNKSAKIKVNEDIITGINEDKLRSMIKDVLIEYLSNDYNKKLTENVVKTLVNAGKVKIKNK